MQLSYTEDELMSEHDYAEPHLADGRRLHGGFMADGSYQPPRSLDRVRAFDSWATALEGKGGGPLAADSSLLTGVRLPNLDQHLLLLRSGIGRHFWNMLTVTGKIEARGRLLAEIDFPDLQDSIVEDISEMAIGHLNKGLLVAHGLDEGGVLDRSIGAHDEMWFAARDLAFGPGAFDDVEPPDRIGRPETGDRAAPEVSPEAEGLLSFLMNLLIIEFRAEIGFAMTQDILRTPDLFTDRREATEDAAEIIERIRIDELIHVSSLCLYLGELRTVNFRTVDGGQIAGAELIDRMWNDLVRWATVDQPVLAARQLREALEPLILEHPEGAAVLTEFDRISDLAPLPAEESA